MEIKLDNSIKDIINQNYQIDPSVLIEIEQRRQTSESINNSILDILKSAPKAPPEPKQTDSITDQITNNSNYEYTLKERQIKSILDLLSLVNASINKTTTVIQKIDNEIITLIDEINKKINDVKNAYDSRITVGCRSNLIWKDIGSSTTYSPGTGTTVTYSNYIVVKNPEEEITTNYYGLKYFQKPSNRDYGINIISEINGSILVGKNILTVLGVGQTLGIQVGDEITDNLSTPVAFNIGNLPKVVGFGNTSVVGITTTLTGNVSLGSNIIVHNGLGSTANISIGTYVSGNGVFDEPARVVGFGTTTLSITSYDVGSSTITTTNVTVTSIILNKVSKSSLVGATFGFGSNIQYKSLILSASSNLTLNNKQFTVIRKNGDITENFNYTNNPIDPITIGIINNENVGVGNQAELVNNGNTSGPSQWKKILGNPEPSIGAGQVKYYTGQALWPYETIVGYASEGIVYTFTSETIPTYTSISPTGLTTSGVICNSYSLAITEAENGLQKAIDTNLPIIQKLISDTTSFRKYRDGDEFKAWSYLQAISYLRGDANSLQFDYNSLNYNSLGNDNNVTGNGNINPSLLHGEYDIDIKNRGQIGQIIFNSPSGVIYGADELYYVSGNVGIGTITPSANLHVDGDVRITRALYDSNNATGTSGQVLQSVGTGISWVTFSGGGSGGIVTQTQVNTSYTTASLSQNVGEDFTMNLGKLSELVSIQVSHPSWVRIYRSSTQRASDPRTSPGGPLQSIINLGDRKPYSENVTTSNSEIIIQNPVPLLQGDADGLVYIRLIKRNAGSNAVTLTTTTYPLEI
jgi:hypothetical protein